MSHFSSWNCQTLTTRRSPSRIHMRFFNLPGIRPSRLLPSAHITRTRDAPSSWSAIPRISPSFVRGIRTRTTSSSATSVSMGRDGLNVCGFTHSGRSTASGTRARSSMRVSPAGVLAGGPLRGVHDVRPAHFLELPSQALVLHGINVVDHFPEVLAGDPPLFEDHQGGQDCREIEPAGDLEQARPVLPHEREASGLSLHSIELLRRVSDDPLRVDDQEELLVVTEVLGEEVDVLDRPEFSVKVLILT